MSDCVPVLLPAPRHLRLMEGRFQIRPRQSIRLECACPAELLPAGRIIQKAVRQIAGNEWHVIAGSGGPNGGVSATVKLDPAMHRPQSCRLVIAPDQATITASDPAGAFYGAQTLAQLLSGPLPAPAVVVEDWPDFPVRGVMLDISRDKVPTMATLRSLIDELAAMKINQVQLYTEHTFQYRSHPEVWADASPITGEEILDLDAFCRERFLELVPNQNSFGHLERWLAHPQYLPLAEAPDGFDFPWGRHDGPFSLCPIDPRSIELVDSLYEELLPHFSSRMLNVGCDETFDVGQGRSREECQKRGRERVYFDYLLKVYALAKEHGRRMQFWGDIILHSPELIGELPKDVIALEWGYEADHPFDRDGALFKQGGLDFYVCPGTSSWCSISGRTDNAIANLQRAAEHGLRHGAVGYLNTDWGDWGHLQYLPVSYLGFAAGAAYSWCWESNRDLQLVEALDRHVFRDRAGVMGGVARDLGNVYQTMQNRRNSTVLFWRLAGNKQRNDIQPQPAAAEIDAASQAIRACTERLSDVRLDRPDGGLVTDEYRNAGAMLLHACRRARWMLNAGDENPLAMADDLTGIIAEHRRLWLARNRIGGLSNSARRLEEKVKEYRAGTVRPPG